LHGSGLERPAIGTCLACRDKAQARHPMIIGLPQSIILRCPVPVVPSCLLEPAWVEFCALLDERHGGQPPQFDPGHPLGCHRRRVPDQVVFEHVVAALVHGSGYERIATPGCSDRTIRRRLAEWAELGLGEAVHAAALRAYDQVIGLELADVAVDGCHTTVPCGGERAGPSPVDRRKGGLKRSVASDGHGIPLGIASAPGNRHDSPLLAPPCTPPARSWTTSCPTAVPATWTPAMTAP
jgi:hypothetical protein